jgi:hypothetical protein
MTWHNGFSMARTRRVNPECTRQQQTVPGM